MPTSISSSTSIRSVCTKNEHTGKSQSDAVRAKNEHTGNSVESTFSNFGSSQKSQSDAVCTKNEHILINTIKDTTNDTINDTSIGLAQQTDEKKRSVTFSITESQLKKMDQEARKNGFKNKSEMLASFIDAL